MDQKLAVLVDDGIVERPGFLVLLLTCELFYFRDRLVHPAVFPQGKPDREFEIESQAFIAEIILEDAVTVERIGV